LVSALQFGELQEAVAYEQVRRSRANLSAMLTKAANLTGANDIAGYGFDAARAYTGGTYYGQKGGLIADAASVFQFDDQWGFVLCFGSPAQLDNQPPNPGPSWYPDFTAAMNIAKNATWTQDLFPTFGMPAL
jgi:hypothetical protein